MLRGGATMPLLGLGTGGVPGLEGSEAIRIVEWALREGGVRCVDTAPDYHNEEAVGEALRRSGVPRENLFVTTKVSPLSHGYDATLASVHRSLARLRLGWLDCVVLHWPGAWVREQQGWSAAEWTGECYH